MKIVCALKDHPFSDSEGSLGVLLYDRPASETMGSAGGAIKYQVWKDKLVPAARAWDFLSLGLAVTAADLAGHRGESADGWTRQFELEIAVSDPAFWNSQVELVRRLLGFLTTDQWTVRFLDGGFHPAPAKDAVKPEEDSLVLLSGGLDSLVGTIDLAAVGKHPIAVSHIVRGDAENQRHFAESIGGGLRHFQINHNAQVPDPESPPSQRARSLVFLGCGVLAATALKRHHEGQEIPLYICENGFISINPPLTDSRLGSLSTRTTHPEFLGLVQKLLANAGLHVKIDNPYQLRTKGEMLQACRDQTKLAENAARSVSCGRYRRFGNKHCGRCVPCLVRRAAFLKWGLPDSTEYLYADLGRDDEEHAGFDDVRSVAMAILAVAGGGVRDWVGTGLSTAILGDVAQLESMVCRGLDELNNLLKTHGVK